MIINERRKHTRRRLNNRSKKPCLRGDGGCSSMRSCDGVPFGPKVFSSLKHSVSIIYTVQNLKYTSDARKHTRIKLIFALPIMVPK